MIALSTLTLFLSATLIMLLIPGPAVLYIIARSIDQGKVAGMVSGLGMTISTLFHITAAAFVLTAYMLYLLEIWAIS